jgi:hypothetical protein
MAEVSHGWASDSEHSESLPAHALGEVANTSNCVFGVGWVDSDEDMPDVLSFSPATHVLPVLVSDTVCDAVVGTSEHVEPSGWAAHSSDDDDIEVVGIRPDDDGAAASCQIVLAASSSRRGRPKGLFGCRELRTALRQYDDSNSYPEHAIVPHVASALSFPMTPTSFAWLRPVGVLGQENCTAHRKVSAHRCVTAVNRARRLHALADRYIADVPQPCMSAAAEAAVLNTNRSRLSSDTVALASLVHAGSRVLWSSFFSWVLSQLQCKAFRGLALVTYLQWDETPTQLNLDDFLNGQGIGPTVQPQSKHSKQTAKVVQTEFSFGLLLMIDGRPTFISGELPCILAVVEKCNSECYGACLDFQTKIELLRDLRPHFEMVIHSATTDRDSANLRLQRAWMHADPHTPHLYLPCQIHCLSTVQGKSLSTLDRDVSGTIALAVAMQPGRAVLTFRAALATSLEKFIDVFPDSVLPSNNHPDIVAKHALWDLLLPAGLPSSSQRKATLHFYLNGFVSDRLEHVGNASKQHIAREIAAALLPCAVRLFPRHRWCTSRQTFAEAALLASLCSGKVFVQAVEIWFSRSASKYTSSGHWDVVLAGNDGADSSENKWVQLAEQARTDVLEWSVSVPGPRLIVMVCTMGPQVGLMACFLHDGSQGADFNRMVSALHGQSAEFRLTSAYQGTRALDLFKNIRELMWPNSERDDVWKVLAPHQRSRALSSTAFAMLAKAAAGVHASLFVPQQGYPYKLFGVILNNGLAEEIFNKDPACLHDPFTKAYLAAFPNPAALISEDSLSILSALVIILRIDTLRIECKHASIRRVKLIASQTHTQALEQASAHFVLAQQRLIEGRFGDLWGQMKSAGTASKGRIVFVAIVQSA